MTTRILRAGAAIAGLTGLLFTAACGDGGGERARTERAARKTAVAAKGTVLTQQQLEKAAVAKEDLPGYTVDWLTAHTTAPSLPTDPAQCQAVGDTLGLVSRYRPTARLIRIVTKPGEDGATLALAAYRAGDAERAMADIRMGLRTCPGRSFAPGDSFHYQEVAALPGRGQGDESVSFKLVQVMEGVKQRPAFTFVVVRSGSTVAIFRAMNLNGRPAVVSAGMVDAQVRKVTKS
ncbi:hypothetical protein AB0D12_16695 [Streptomyces sp. NPDC048479]|uniref:hypothetical protein n=1 Tax=Streptomyces sp. NPDC048479 TaxID=3154725 RepID=UPI0034414B33